MYHTRSHGKVSRVPRHISVSRVPRCIRMCLQDINSLPDQENISAMRSASDISRSDIKKDLPACRHWLVKNRPETYTVVGHVTTHQTQTARSGDYCHMDDGSEEEEEEATSSDEEFVEEDGVSSGDSDYGRSDGEEESSDEDEEMAPEEDAEEDAE
jgi:hypothetical protein